MAVRKGHVRGSVRSRQASVRPAWSNPCVAGYEPSTYGDRIAAVYDEWLGVPQDTDDAVAFLAGLAGQGPALELGIGTGRVELPLAARGVEVHGIDASEAMVARLHAKPGGEAIPVTIGDFADVPVEGAFPLVFVVFNTFFALLSQEAQVRCFENAARRLAPGGAFVLQAFGPTRRASASVRRPTRSTQTAGAWCSRPRATTPPSNAPCRSTS